MPNTRISAFINDAEPEHTPFEVYWLYSEYPYEKKYPPNAVVSKSVNQIDFTTPVSPFLVNINPLDRLIYLRGRDVPYNSKYGGFAIGGL